jgi:hypothetical protein
MIKTNYEIIRVIVESNAPIKDLSIRGQFREVSLSRCVYYQLGLDYLKKDYNHTTASKTIKKGHNNSIYSLENFKRFKDQKFFKEYMNLYVDCGIELLELEIKINELIKDGLPRTQESDTVLY